MFYVNSARRGRFVRKLTNAPPLALLTHILIIHLKKSFIKQFYGA